MSKSQYQKDLEAFGYWYPRILVAVCIIIPLIVFGVLKPMSEGGGWERGYYEQEAR
jgi:hypothetical protein